MIKQLLYNTFISTRTFPKNFKENDIPFFEKEFEKKINPSYIFQFKNVVVTYEGAVINNLKVVPESLNHSDTTKGFCVKHILKTIINKKKIQLGNEKFLLPFNSWGTGYGHWVTETLPRIHAVKEILSECTILLPEGIHPNFLMSLRPFSYKSIFYIPTNAYVKAPNLIMPTLIALTGNYNDMVMQSLRQFYKNYYKNESGLPKQNIYLSREKALKRKVKNENELIPILKKFNFKIIYVEQLNFEEQISLFLNCDCLISIHGATLANILFLDKNSKVLELRKENDNSNLCYFSLASALGINYYYQFCKAENAHLSVQDADIIVDVELFEKQLMQLAIA